MKKGYENGYGTRLQPDKLDINIKIKLNMESMGDAKIFTRRGYEDKHCNYIVETCLYDEMMRRETYDRFDNLIEVIMPVILRTRHDYDENGNEVKRNFYVIGMDGTENGVYNSVMEYDEECRLIDMECDAVDEGHSHMTYRYDVLDGKTIQKAYDRSGNLVDVKILEIKENI